jgi:hypothetical protein
MHALPLGLGTCNQTRSGHTSSTAPTTSVVWDLVPAHTSVISVLTHMNPPTPTPPNPRLSVLKQDGEEAKGVKRHIGVANMVAHRLVEITSRKVFWPRDIQVSVFSEFLQQGLDFASAGAVLASTPAGIRCCSEHHVVRGHCTGYWILHHNYVWLTVPLPRSCNVNRCKIR